MCSIAESYCSRVWLDFKYPQVLGIDKEHVSVKCSCWSWHKSQTPFVITWRFLSWVLDSFSEENKRLSAWLKKMFYLFIYYNYDMNKISASYINQNNKSVQNKHSIANLRPNQTNLSLKTTQSPLSLIRLGWIFIFIHQLQIV